MLLERDVEVDHTTIYRWVQKYAPELEKRLCWYYCKLCSWCSSGLDETYIKIAEKWCYLYRATDKYSNTLDFYLFSHRNAYAEKRFLEKLIRGTKHSGFPQDSNTDKAPSYSIALAELKEEGKCRNHQQHRQVKYLNVERVFGL